jgi:hypothetical protein
MSSAPIAVLLPHGFTSRIPVASTVWRLLVRVDAEALSTVLAGWLHARNTATITPTPTPTPAPA